MSSPFRFSGKSRIFPQDIRVCGTVRCVSRKVPLGVSEEDLGRSRLQQPLGCIQLWIQRSNESCFMLSFTSGVSSDLLAHAGGISSPIDAPSEGWKDSVKYMLWKILCFRGHVPIAVAVDINYLWHSKGPPEITPLWVFGTVQP